VRSVQPSAIVLVLLASLLGSRPAAADPRGARAADLDWLAGCWAAEGGEPGSGEQWTAPAGGTLLGVSRTVRGGRTVAHEFLQIRETDDGGVVYVALPSGQAEASFRLVARGAREVTFADPEHDFPQRIRYRLAEDGALHARIEGEVDGHERAVDFTFRRVSCPSAGTAQSSE